MPSSGRDLQRLLSDRAPAVVEGWYQIVHESSAGLLSPTALRRELSDLWDRASTFLMADDVGPEGAELIGAAFSSWRIKPQHVGRVPKVVLSCLLEDPPSELEEVLEARLPDLIAGMTSGLYRDGVETLLEQQEQIRAAHVNALRRAEDQLRIKNAGLESSINAVLMFDLEGRLTYVNPAFLDLWGYEKDAEVLGRHVAEFGSWSGDVERGLELISEQGGWVGELVAVREDGSRFDVQASVSPVVDDEGAVTQLMSFFVDITERKKTEEALKRRAVQAAFLNEIGEEITAQRTAEGVLQRAVQLAQETFDLHQVAVLLLDEDEEKLVVTALASAVDDASTAVGDVAADVEAVCLGEGITGWAARQGSTVVVNDVGEDTRFISPIPKTMETGSELAVPILSGGRVAGVLDVQSPTKDAFGDSDRVVLETLAGQIAVALENARLYQTLQDELVQRRSAEKALRMTVQRLETVHEIDQAILGAKSREEIAEAVVRDLRRLVPCQRVSIDIFDWRSEEVTVLAAIQTIGEGRAKTGARFPLTQREWLFDLWRSGELANIPDARDAPQTSPLVRAVIEDGIKSFLAAPIAYQDDLMGLLTLGSDRVDGFEPEHGPIVREMADTVAIALQQARLLDSVRQQRERLQGTMARLAEVEETERRRVVRELHDQVGQNLTALDLNLSLVRTQLKAEGLREIGARVDDSLALVEQTNERIRRLMVDLRPPVLDDYGLLSALRWYGDRFSGRTGIDVVVEGKEEVTRELSLHVENALFRIAQEALNNAAKHSEADRVTIALSSDDTLFRLRIRDNGVGFEPEDLEGERSGWGLLTMRERAESVGARCIFESTSDAGACVEVEVPR